MYYIFWGFFGLLLILLVLDFIARHPLFALRFYFGPAHFYYQRFPVIPKNLRHTPCVDVLAGVTGNLSYILGGIAKGKPIRFVTDQWGYRNLPGAETAKPDTLILGNCFVNASKTAQGEMLSEQLARRGRCCYNMAVDGINLWEEVVNFKYHFETNPLLAEVKRVVWVIFEGNDLEGEFRHHTDPAELTVGMGKQLAVSLENYYKSSVLRRIYKVLFGQRPNQGVVLSKDFAGREMLFFEPYVRFLAQTESEVRDHANFPAVARTFSQMAEFCRNHQIEVHCLFVPVKPRVYEWVLREQSPWSLPPKLSPFAGVVGEICQQHGFSFLDLTNPLTVRAKEVFEERQEVIYWLDDTHWNHEGIAVADEQVHRLLQKRCE